MGSTLNTNNTNTANNVMKVYRLMKKIVSGNNGYYIHDNMIPKTITEKQVPEFHKASASETKDVTTNNKNSSSSSSVDNALKIHRLMNIIPGGGDTSPFSTYALE